MPHYIEIWILTWFLQTPYLSSEPILYGLLKFSFICFTCSPQAFFCEIWISWHHDESFVGLWTRKTIQSSWFTSMLHSTVSFFAPNGQTNCSSCVCRMSIFSTALFYVDQTFAIQFQWLTSPHLHWLKHLTLCFLGEFCETDRLLAVLNSFPNWSSIRFLLWASGSSILSLTWMLMSKQLYLPL